MRDPVPKQKRRAKAEEARRFRFGAILKTALSVFSRTRN